MATVTKLESASIIYVSMGGDEVAGFATSANSTNSYDFGTTLQNTQNSTALLVDSIDFCFEN